MRYAKETTVSVEKSEAEIKSLLVRYGASHTMFGTSPDSAVIQFRMLDRIVKFVITMPDPQDFKRTPVRKDYRTPEAAHKEWEKACRQRWRALALVIKAKLEAVESGIAEFEEEFLSYMLMPDGKTVGEHVRPGIAAAYESGEMPKLLTGWTDG